MSGKRASEIHLMKRGEVRVLTVDWGENTSQQKTGVLAAGATVSSCTVAVTEKPSGATDPTLSAVSVPTNSANDDVNGRVWSTGEVTTCTCTTASDQALGLYVFTFTASTSNSETIKAEVAVRVVA
jgi:hypothetical protein